MVMSSAVSLPNHTFFLLGGGGEGMGVSTWLTSTCAHSFARN